MSRPTGEQPRRMTRPARLWGVRAMAAAVAAALALSLPLPAFGAAEDAATTLAPVPGLGDALQPATPAGQALRIDHCDVVVRPPSLFRLSLARHATPAEAGRGPMLIEISLAQGQVLLAADRIELAHLGDLAQGLSVALAPSGLDPQQGDTTVWLRVTLMTALAPQLGEPYVAVEELSRELPTPRSLASRLDALQARLHAAAPTAALPWLWEEQCEEIVNGQTSTRHCVELMRLEGLMQAALTAGTPPPQPDGPLYAYRDTIDGSVQPERRYAPPGAVRGTAWLLTSPSRTPQKCDWPEPDEQLLDGAAQAGVELVQLYPAGDLGWDGAALLRALRRLRDPGHGPVLLIGQGRGAVGALRLLALAPQCLSGVRLLDPQLGDALDPLLLAGAAATVSGHLDDTWSHFTPALRTGGGPQTPAFWQADATPPVSVAPARPFAQVAPELAAPATHYALGPFVVVVGMGEHRAAQQDDRALATAFCHAWAAHAHGLPPCIDDTAFQPGAWRGYTWILIGNPRSNRVIGHLVRHHPLPITWDSRSLTFQNQVYLRADRRAVALAVPRSDGGQALLLDGAPAWSAGGLPLVGVTLPYLGAVAAPEVTSSPSAPASGPMMARP